MNEYINNAVEVSKYRNERLMMAFTDYCDLATRLLKDNPDGLPLKSIQTSVGISAKTAKQVLAFVADKNGDTYYPKLKQKR